MRFDPIAVRLMEPLEGLSLLDGVFTLAAGDRAIRPSPAMRLMHASFVARIYDSLWRPSLIWPFSSLTYAAEDRIVDRHLEGSSNLRLLDLCCGTARTSRRWIPKGAEVLGIDTSLPMLREARRRCASDCLVLLHADAGRDIAKAGSFDAAFCFAALHLMDEPERVLGQAARALRSGGLVFAWVATTRGMLRHRGAEWCGLLAWGPELLTRRIEAHGFEVLENLVFGAIELVVARRRR